MDMKFIYNPLYKEFHDLFSESFDLQVVFVSKLLLLIVDM